MSDDPTTPHLPDTLTDAAVADVIDAEQWDRLRVTGPLEGGVIDLLDVSECRLVGVIAHALEIRNLSLTDVLLEGCDLSGSLLRGAVLRRVHFRDCRLSGVVFDGSTMRDVVFTACKLDSANFRSLDTQRLHIDASVLSEADFTAARLAGAQIRDCDLRRARFTKAAARGLRLVGSDVNGIAGADSLRGAVIDDGQVAPFALAVFDALGVSIDRSDDLGPGSS